jgi:pimeloyl-ACP methyl ester carboxylesterase
MRGTGVPFTIETEDGLTLRCARWGDGPVDVVFIHGAGLSAQCYWPALRAISDLAVIHGFNSRGHGGSDVPHVLSPYEEPYEDLVRFIATSCRTPVVMAGHSFGAFLTLRAAAERPDLIRGILLLDPLITFAPHELWQIQVMDMDLDRVARTRRKPASWPDRAATQAWVMARSGFKRWDREALHLYLATCMRQGAEGVSLCCPPWFESLLYMHRPFLNFWPWIARIAAPTAIIYGEDSEVARPAAIAYATQMLPRATVMRLKGGHLFAQEHPRETGEALRTALTTVLADQR